MLRGREKYKANLDLYNGSSDDDDEGDRRFERDRPANLRLDGSPEPEGKEPEIKPLRDLDDKDKKKKAIRAPLPKLDAELWVDTAWNAHRTKPVTAVPHRLLSEKGLPKLKKKIPTLKLKGKGHEVCALISFGLQGTVRAPTLTFAHPQARRPP